MVTLFSQLQKNTANFQNIKLIILVRLDLGASIAVTAFVVTAVVGYF